MNNPSVNATPELRPQTGVLPLPLTCDGSIIHGLPLWLESTEKVNSVVCEYARQSHIYASTMHDLRIHLREMKIRISRGSEEDPNDLRNYISCRGVGPKTMALIYKATTGLEPPVIMIEAFIVLDYIRDGFGFLDDKEYEEAVSRGHERVSKISEGHTLTKREALNWLLTRDDSKRRRNGQQPEFQHTLKVLLEWLGQLIVEVKDFVAYRPYFEAEAWVVEAMDKTGTVYHVLYEGIPTFVDESQRRAIIDALESDKPIVAITGAAGTGKSFIIGEICRILMEHNPSFSGLLCAPTGKAADVLNKRVVNRGGFFLGNAVTVHRGYYKFFSSDSPLFNVCIIDESSMLDSGHIAMISHLMDPEKTMKIIMVGDPNQLPPVGGGRPFADLIRAGIPTFKLETPHRCTDVEKLKFFNSILKARRLERDDLPGHILEYCPAEVESELDRVIDDMFERSDDWYNTSIICALENKVINYLNYQSLKRLKGYKNEAIEELIASGKWKDKGVRNRFWTTEDYWCFVGAKVMFLSNGVDEDKRPVYNGMTAIVESVVTNKWGDVDSVTLDVGEDLPRTLSDGGDYPLGNVALGYAMTVHKSQGSGYDFCAYFHTNNVFEMNELIYTACTRAAKDFRIYTPEMESLRIGYLSHRTTLIDMIGGKSQ